MIKGRLQVGYAIRNFIKTKPEIDTHIDLPMMSLFTYIDIMKELGFEKGEYDCNSYACDFFQDYFHSEYGKYCLGGISLEW